MGFLKPSAPRARRVPKQRVFLSREDRKAVNALRRPERIAGYAAALWGAVLSVAITAYSEDGFGGRLWWRLPLALTMCTVFAVLVTFMNRWMAGIGALGVVYGCPWGNAFLLALPPLFYFAWIQLRIYKDQRALITQRAAEGNYGDAPGSAQARRSAKEARNGKALATEDASGRAYAPKSSRYTPPKATKGKR